MAGLTSLPGPGPDPVEDPGPTTLRLRELLRRDDHAAHSTLFLRLLYSPAAAATAFALAATDDALPRATLALLRDLDPRLLGLEQRARRRQLRWHLARELPLLPRLVPDAEIDAALASFLDAPAFWEGAGRTIGESFCLHLVSRPTLSEPTRLLVRLAAVLSALANRPTLPSPWPARGPALALPEARATETLLSGWRLVEAWRRVERGGFEPGSPVGEGTSLTVATVDGDGVVRVAALEVGA